MLEGLHPACPTTNRTPSSRKSFTKTRSTPVTDSLRSWSSCSPSAPRTSPPWDKVTITADRATIDLAGLPIELPSPLDEPLRALAASNYNGQTAAHPKSPWVFRGYRPGTYINPAHLRTKLKPVLAALEARLGTLNELTQTTPIAILAETFGYHPADARGARQSLRCDICPVHRNEALMSRVTDLTEHLAETLGYSPQSLAVSAVCSLLVGVLEGPVEAGTRMSRNPSQVGRGADRFRSYTTLRIEVSR